MQYGSGHPDVYSSALLINGASIQPSNCVRDLGVVVDSELTLVDHVTHITSVCFFHIQIKSNQITFICFSS